MWIRQKDYKVVGKGLAEARQRTGCTQQELAKRLGKPQSFVSAYERGQRRIDLLEFIRIMETLGLDPGNVFTSVLKRASKD